MRFIHLMHDDKFFDTAIEIFNSLTDQENLFIVGTDTDNYSIKYIRSRLVSVMKYNSLQYKNLITTIQSDDIIVTHYLDRQKASVINAITANPKILWLSFGAELYTSPEYDLPLHCPYTRLLVALNPKNIARRVRSAYRTYSKFHKDPVNAAIPKIKYLATPLDGEFKLFLKYFPGLTATQVFFQYGSLEQILGEAFHKNTPLGNGVFIGNSNTPASNHVDAFRFIKKIKIKGAKVVVPLSYGGDRFYKSAVMIAGKINFGTDFQPQLHFLDRTAYVEKLAECGTAVFMHIRQQAIGNIFIALWLGLKVFLLKENPCFAHFKSKGIAIYLIDKFAETEFNTPLPADQKMLNRQLLISHFGRREVYQKIKLMLELFSSGENIKSRHSY